MQPEDVDLFLSIAMSRMFLEYRLDMQGAEEGRLIKQYECQQQVAELEGQHTVTIAQGKFMRPALEMLWKCSSADRWSI